MDTTCCRKTKSADAFKLQDFDGCAKLRDKRRSCAPGENKGRKFRMVTQSTFFRSAYSNRRVAASISMGSGEWNGRRPSRWLRHSCKQKYCAECISCIWPVARLGCTCVTGDNGSTALNMCHEVLPVPRHSPHQPRVCRHNNALDLSSA